LQGAAREVSYSACRPIKEIEKKALALSPEQRALLAEALLNSLTPVGDEMSEEAEIEEASRRDKEIETGQVQAISEEEFRRRPDVGAERA
jgi:putative addiction module component (TIGR02574 family)